MSSSRPVLEVLLSMQATDYTHFPNPTIVSVNVEGSRGTNSPWNRLQTWNVVCASTISLSLSLSLSLSRAITHWLNHWLNHCSTAHHVCIT
jgi:hypothetical protein